MTVGKNKGHYLKKNIYFVGNDKTTDRHYSLQSLNILLFINSTDKRCSWTVCTNKFFQLCIV